MDLETFQELKDDRDLHLILVVAASDLVLTFYGLVKGSGAEVNPLYRPFTVNPYHMLLGAFIYVVLLVTGSMVLKGRKRKVIGSAVFGMHVGGASSWIALLTPLSSNWWYHALLATLSTSVFYSYLYD